MNPCITARLLLTKGNVFSHHQNLLLCTWRIPSASMSSSNPKQPVELDGAQILLALCLCSRGPVLISIRCCFRFSWST